MNSRGLLHFDAHFENILTDGRRLYFADYGLAISSGFELSQNGEGRYQRVRAYAEGERPSLACPSRRRDHAGFRVSERAGAVQRPV